MPDTVSKTNSFLRAIEKYAEEQRTRIQSEAEDFKTTELNKAEEEALREAYLLIQKKMSDIKTEIATELSKAENASRRKIFAHRQEMEEKVFSEAKQRLLEHTKTPAYGEDMKKSLAAIFSVLDQEDLELFVCRRDLELAERLVKESGRGVPVSVDDDIVIGGMRGRSRQSGLIADETLDSKLELQREWFIENSGLTV